MMKKRDGVGEKHADVGVALDAAQVAADFLFGAQHAALQAQLFHLLRGLPEKQVGRNRGAQQRDDHHPVARGPLQLGNHQVMQHLRPLHLHQEHGDHVGKQEERQPFQDGRQLAVGHKHLQQHGDDTEGHRMEMVAAAHHQLQRLAHGGDVGRDVDGVGDHQQKHHAHQKGARRVLAQVGRHALAGDAPDARAD
jgi:hypothetical protein